jgi:hypothetical protein
MKPIAGPLFAAVVIVVLGGAFWIAGQNDRRLADVHAQLATLRYAAADTAGGDVEEGLALERRLPVLGPAAAADVRDARASAGYWRADYAAIAPKRDANGVVTETDPAILLLTANGAYRASQAATDRNEVVRRLDTVVKSYAEVLKAPAGSCQAGPQTCEARAMDAAFNYEFAIRAREAAAKAKPGPAPKNAAARAAVMKAVDEGDLPSGSTLHGKPGGPPPAVDMNQFKIVIPKRGEERKDAPDAGKGGTKIRKG